MNVSTTIPTTVQIARGHLIGLIVAAAVLAVAITWLLVAFAFDSGATPAQQSTSQPGAATPVAVTGFYTGPVARSAPIPARLPRTARMPAAGGVAPPRF